MRKAKSKAALSVSALAMESTSTAAKQADAKLWPVSATVMPLPVSRPSLDGCRPEVGSLRNLDTAMRTPELPEQWPALSSASSKRPSVGGASSMGAPSFWSADAQSLRSNLRIPSSQYSPTSRGQSPRRQTMPKQQAVPVTSWVSFDEGQARGGAGSFPPSPTDSEYTDAASSPSTSRSVSQDTVTPDVYFTANNTRVDLTLPEQPKQSPRPRAGHVSPSTTGRVPRPLSPLTQSPPMTPSLTTRRESNSDSDESSLEIIEPQASVPQAAEELTPAERIVRESKHHWANANSSSPPKTVSKLSQGLPSPPVDAAPTSSTPKGKGSHAGLLRRPSFMRLKSPPSDQKSIKSMPSPSLFNIRIPTREKAPTITPYLSPAATPTSPSESVTSSAAVSVQTSAKPESFLSRRFTKGKQKQRPMSLDHESMDSWELVDDSRPSFTLELDKEMSLYGHSSLTKSTVPFAGSPTKSPLVHSVQSSAASSQFSLTSSRRGPSVPPAPAPSSAGTSRGLTPPSSTTFNMEPVGTPYIPPSPAKEEKKKRPPPPVPPRRRVRQSEKASQLSISVPPQVGSSAASNQPPQSVGAYVEERMSAPPPRYVSYAEPLTPASATSASSTEFHSVSPSTPTFGRGNPFQPGAGGAPVMVAGVAARSYSQSTMLSVGASTASIKSKDMEKEDARDLVPAHVMAPSPPGTYMYAAQGPIWGSLPPPPPPPSIVGTGDVKYPQYWGTSPPGAPAFVPPPVHYHYPVYATMPPGCFVGPMPAPHWHAPPPGAYHHHHHSHPHAHVPPPSPYGLQTCSSLAPCTMPPGTPVMSGCAMPPGTPSMQSYSLPNMSLPPIGGQATTTPAPAPVQLTASTSVPAVTPAPTTAPRPAPVAIRPAATQSVNSAPAQAPLFEEPPRPASPSAASIRSERSYASRPLPMLPPGSTNSSAPNSPRRAAAGPAGLGMDMTPQAPIVVNAMVGSSISNPHNVRSVVASPITASARSEWPVPQQETDLDVLIANLDVGARDGTNYEALTMISEIIGPATPPIPAERPNTTPPPPSTHRPGAGASRSQTAPARPSAPARMVSAESTASTLSTSSSMTARSESSARTLASSVRAHDGGGGGMPVVGTIEVERRRVTKDGRIKLKLALLGVRVDKCGICLSQFKERESAALGPTCQHGFHDKCLRSWLCRSRTCPLCRVSFGAVGRTPHAVRPAVPA